MPSPFKWPDGGVFQGIADHLKLVWRLMLDQRVPFWLKVFPFGSLLYFISRFDLPGPVDDIGVVWLFTYLFIELCPPDVVKQHQREIAQVVSAEWKEADPPGQPGPNGKGPIDAEFREKTDTDTETEQ